MINLQAYKQTTDWTCGPACLCMLSFYRFNYERQITQIDEIQAAKLLGTTEKDGTTIEDFANFMNDLGPGVFFCKEWSKHGDLNDLKRNILFRSWPVIVLLNDDTEDHWVIVNYITEHDIGWIDPYTGKQIHIIMPLFLKMWTGQYVC